MNVQSIRCFIEVVCFFSLMQLLAGCGNLTGYECKRESDCHNLETCFRGSCIPANSSQDGGSKEKDPPINDTKQGVPCFPNEKKCGSSKAVLLCKNDAWETISCASGEECQSGECKRVSVSKCTDGQTRSCGASSTGECKEGIQTCKGGAWGNCTGEVKPSAEVCNDGKDNDCDGQVDENCEAGQVESKMYVNAQGFYCLQGAVGKYIQALFISCPDNPNLKSPLSLRRENSDLTCSTISLKDCTVRLLGTCGKAWATACEGAYCTINETRLCWHADHEIYQTTYDGVKRSGSNNAFLVLR